MPLVEKFIELVIRHRWITLAASLAVSAIATMGAGRLVFEGDYEIFFDDENPMLIAYRDIEDTFTRADTLIFALVPASGNVFERDILAAVKELTAEAWRLPHSRRVNSLSNFQHTVARDDDLAVGDLYPDPAAMSSEEIEQRRQVALSDPMVVRHQVSPSGHVTGVSVSVLLPDDDPDAIGEVALAARALASRFEERHPDIEIRMTGSIIVGQAFNDGAQTDIKTLIPMMYLVMLVILGLLLRSVGAIFITFAAMAASAGTGLGVSGWLGIPMTGPSTSAVTITLMVAVANAVHLLAKFERGLVAGLGRREATVQAVVSNAAPVFLACLTTAIGFLVLNTSELPPYRFMGNTAALGVAAVLVFTFTLVPALMVLLPRRRARPRKAGRAWGTFADRVTQSASPLVWTTLVVVVGLGLFVTKNEFNDQFVAYFEPDNPVRADAEFIGNELTGVYGALYAIPSEGPGGIVQPEFLERIDAFAAWARQHPSVASVSTFTDIMKRLNRSMHGDDDAWYRIPENRELAAQYLLLYELSLPLGLDLTDQVDIDKSRIKLRVGFPNITNKEITGFERDAEEWMRRNWPDHMIASPANPTILFAHIWDIGSKSLLKGLVLAIFVIAVIIAFALRSVKLGLISLLPNLLPALMAFGLWGLVDGRIDISASTVAAISFGIVIDDTIHFLSRFQRGRFKGITTAGAIRYAFAEVGNALLFTTIIVAAGFLVLAQSAFGFNTTMGILTAITVIFALVLDFLFLPSLLLSIEGRRHAKTQLQPAA